MSHRTSPRRGFGRRVTTLTVPLLLAVGGGNAVAAMPAQPSASFVKIDGVPGESTDARHPAESDIQTFHIKATNSTGTAGGGGAGGWPAAATAVQANDAIASAHRRLVGSITAVSSLNVSPARIRRAR